MTGRRPSWETINAYVDGELSPQEMAEVAEAAARDSRVGREIAALARLSAALHEGRERVDPARVMPRRRTGHRRRWLGSAAVAAGLLLVAFAGHLELEGPRPPAALVAATAAHEDWLSALNSGVEARSGDRLKAHLERLDSALFVPDLSDSGLRFSGVRRLPQRGGGTALHVGYLGPKGCTVSLVILPDAGGLPPSREVHEGSFGTAHLWRAGEQAVIVLSATMAPGRLADVAAAIESAMREWRPLDRERHETLQASRRDNPPCLA